MFAFSAAIVTISKKRMQQIKQLWNLFPGNSFANSVNDNILYFMNFSVNLYVLIELPFDDYYFCLTNC